MRQLRLHTLLLIGCLWLLLASGDAVAATTTPATPLQAQDEWVVQERGVVQAAEQREEPAVRSSTFNEAYLLIGHLYLRYLVVGLSLLLLLLVLVFVLLFLLLRERKERRSHHQMAQHYSEQMEQIAGERREQDAKTAEMQQQLAQLFGGQFALIDQLSTIYYETRGLKKDKEAIYKRVCDEIAHWSNQKKNARELEQIVDRYKEGVMAKLRAEMPAFSELDLQILCYSYAGFSTKAISIFLGTTVGTIDTRRYRLRIKIAQQNPPSKELFFEKMK